MACGALRDKDVAAAERGGSSRSATCSDVTAAALLVHAERTYVMTEAISSFASWSFHAGIVPLYVLPVFATYQSADCRDEPGRVAAWRRTSSAADDAPLARSAIEAADGWCIRPTWKTRAA